MGNFILRWACFFKKYLWLLAMAGSIQLYGQAKLSPKFNTVGGRYSAEPAIFSISCRDTAAFKSRHQAKTIWSAYRNNINTALISAPYDVIMNQLLRDSNIIFIDIPGTPLAESTSEYANPAFNRINKAWHFFPALTGANSKISIKEQSFNPADIDLVNRSFETMLTPVGVSQHATAMATLIAGGGNSSPKGKGVATAAVITSSGFENILPDADEIFSAHDIHLQNHSYGVAIENYYGNEAAAYDQQTFQHPDLLHVFSAGNSGQSQPTDGIYKGMSYANLSGNFKQAKNVLLVTAVDTSLTVNPLNSRGPAFDGRLKPELTAYGQGGTSEAAALASGISALVQQQYLSLHGVYPPAALIKAVLIASADDLGNKGIDYLYGYGSINAWRALQLIIQQYTATLSLSNEEERIFTIHVPDAASALKVAVVWNDPPAVPGSEAVLIHDIDAYITDGTGQYNPWVLSSAPDADSLSAPAVRKKDRINNIEYITLADIPAGDYTLTIKAPSLTTQTQPVSIAYWIEPETTFTWDYPTGTDILASGQQQLLFWQHHTTGEGRLSLQLNEGDWVTINNQVDLSNAFHWTPPDTLARARLRMTINGIDHVSDEFLISPELKMRVAFNCDQNFSLTWNSVPGAEAYEVYAMGDKYLEKIAATADSAVVLTKDSPNVYYAVAPLLNNSRGLTSPAINYTLQGIFCYVNLFTAERYDSRQVAVRLNLSTASGIDRIAVMKTAGGQQQLFKEFTPAKGTLDYELLDDVLIPTVMTYQAVLFFKDGTSITSDISSIYIEDGNKATLFPNPVQEVYLNVLSAGSGSTIRITDRIGQLRIEKKLITVLDTINVESLEPGLYLYQLIRNGIVTDTGKFIRI